MCDGSCQQVQRPLFLPNPGWPGWQGLCDAEGSGAELTQGLAWEGQACGAAPDTRTPRHILHAHMGAEQAQAHTAPPCCGSACAHRHAAWGPQTAGPMCRAKQQRQGPCGAPWAAERAPAARSASLPWPISRRLPRPPARPVSPVALGGKKYCRPKRGGGSSESAASRMVSTCCASLEPPGGSHSSVSHHPSYRLSPLYSSAASVSRAPGTPGCAEARGRARLQAAGQMGHPQQLLCLWHLPPGVCQHPCVSGLANSLGTRADEGAAHRAWPQRAPGSPRA